MNKPNFIGGVFLIGYEAGVKITEIDTSTISNLELDKLLKIWKMIGLTWNWDLRF